MSNNDNGVDNESMPIVVTHNSFIRFGDKVDDVRDPLIDVKLGKSFGITTRVPEHLTYTFSSRDEFDWLTNTIRNFAELHVTGCLNETLVADLRRLIVDVRQFVAGALSASEDGVEEGDDAYSTILGKLCTTMKTNEIETMLEHACGDAMSMFNIFDKLSPLPQSSETMKIGLQVQIDKCRRVAAGADCQATFLAHMKLFDFFLFTFPKMSSSTYIVCVFFQQSLCGRLECDELIDDKKLTALENIGANRLFMLYYNWIAINTYHCVTTIVAPTVGRVLASLDNKTYAQVSLAARSVYWSDKPRTAKSSVAPISWPVSFDKERMAVCLCKLVPQLNLKSGIEQRENELNNFQRLFSEAFDQWFANNDDAAHTFMRHGGTFSTMTLFALYALLCAGNNKRYFVEDSDCAFLSGALSPVQTNDFWLSSFAAQTFGLMTNVDTFKLASKNIDITKLCATSLPDKSVWIDILNNSNTHKMLDLLCPLSVSDSKMPTDKSDEPTSSSSLVVSLLLSKLKERPRKVKIVK